MPWGTPSSTAAPINQTKVGESNLGDVGAAQPLKLMRGVDITARYFCYLINVSAYRQDIPKGSRNYQIPGIVVDGPEVDGIKYAIGSKIPSTVVDTWIDQESKRRPETQEGEEVAQDAICPRIGPTSDNNDLSKWGCGYIKRLPNEAPVPTYEELLPIKEAYDNNMRQWLADGDKQVNEGLPANINPIHIRAAQHFKADRPWSQKIEHPKECPGCGETMKKNALRHTVQSGGCGYIAPENRQKGFEMGLVTREEAEMWGLISPKPATEPRDDSGRFTKKSS